MMYLNMSVIKSYCMNLNHVVNLKIYHESNPNAEMDAN